MVHRYIYRLNHTAKTHSADLYKDMPSQPLPVFNPKKSCGKKKDPMKKYVNPFVKILLLHYWKWPTVKSLYGSVEQEKDYSTFLQ